MQLVMRRSRIEDGWNCLKINARTGASFHIRIIPHWITKLEEEGRNREEFRVTES
jgi:hypothetical protein